MSVVVPIVVALIGLLGAYLYQLRLARRKDRLDLVNRQLNDFYGPLYVSVQAGKMAMSALLDRMGKDAIFADKYAPTVAELEEWKIWLPAVISPLNDAREMLIIKNSHLIREEIFPSCLLAFVAHASAYKAVLLKWQKGDYSEVLSIVDYPRDLEYYAELSYRELKTEQAFLIRKVL